MFQLLWLEDILCYKIDNCDLLLKYVWSNYIWLNGIPNYLGPIEMLDSTATIVDITFT